MSTAAGVVSFLVIGTAVSWFTIRAILRARNSISKGLNDAAYASPRENEKANDFVRFWGFGMALTGGAMIAFGHGWVVAHLIPLQLCGVLVALFGCWMMTFPEKYRELRRKSGR